MVRPQALNDDAPGGGRTSLVRFAIQPWQVYYIAVDGYDGASGNLRLSINWQPTPTPPLNDDFGKATPLIGLQTAVNASSVNSTKQPGEWAHAGNAGGSSVWWSWTAPASGRMAVCTKGSAFDTLLAVYTGPEFAALSLVAANDDDPLHPPTSFATFNANAGVTYFIAIDGLNGANGPISLSLLSDGVPAPRLLSVQASRTLCKFQVVTETADWLLVEHSANLIDWTSVSTNQVPAGTNTLTIPNAPDGPSPHLS